MPKPRLIRDHEILEQQIVETMLAGLKEWRSDLAYPESHSDMQAAVRGLLRMFEVTRRPLHEPLAILCRTCDGTGYWIIDRHNRKICEDCKGNGYINDKGPHE